MAEAVLRPLGKLWERGVVCPAAVKDPQLGEGDIHHCDVGTDEVDGVDVAFGVVVEVSADDYQGSFRLTWVVGEDGVARGRE